MNIHVERRVAEIAGGGPRVTSAWERRYVQDLVLFDIVAASVGATLALLTRFGFDNATLGVWDRGVPYGLLTAVFVAVWIALMGISGSYSTAVVGAGPEEYRRIVNVAVRFIAALAVGAFALRVDVARGFVACLVPLITVSTVTGRWTARRWLHRQRALGACSRTVVVTGTRAAVIEVVRHLDRVPYAGYRVVGACTEGDEPIITEHGAIPVLGSPHDVLAALRASGAGVLAVSGDVVPGTPSVRELACALEGGTVDLVVAPSLTAVAGPRIGVRPVAGLPLLVVERPRFSGPVRVIKGCIDRAGAALAITALLPVFAVLAVLVRTTSRGPVLFRQVRVGINGERFVIWKLRTMVDDAELLLDDLRSLNDHDGLLFKMRADPRVTPVGRVLRRWSLDELPQLVQVLTGKMSLIGPRPPLPSEVERYEDDVARRLLVKPGVTGLWQTSGRAELSWEEGVRLDTYYVENWSLTLDLVIAWKTLAAVVRGRGAY